MFFGGQRTWILAVKILRALLLHPGDAWILAGAGRRQIRRAGGIRALWRAWRAGSLSVKTFVVHNFMDAAVVAPAWELMLQGRTSDDPAVREAQERLGACMYTMSHP